MVMKTPVFWCKASLLTLAVFWLFMYIVGPSRAEGIETNSDKIVGLLGFIIFALLQIFAGVILPLTLLETRYAKKEHYIELPMQDWIIGLPLLLLRLPGPLSRPNVRVPRGISYPVSILGGLIASFFISVFGTLLFLASIGELK
jgi:hypothetical protein